jgi:Methyltransferase domain
MALNRLIYWINKRPLPKLEFGADISLPLLKTCNLETVCTENRKIRPHRSQLRRRPALAVADCLMLPIKDNSVDAALCIAVLCHTVTRPTVSLV